MPTYDFACTACDHAFEAVLPIGSRRKPKCPKCGSGKTEKRISPPAIHFRGSGFFVTDHGKKQETKPAAPKEAVKEKEPTKKETPAKEG